MRKYLVVLFAIAGVCLLAPAAFAQTAGEAAAAEGTNWVAITSGFAMAIASAACGYAQARLRPQLRKAWRAIPARPA